MNTPTRNIYTLFSAELLAKAAGFITAAYLARTLGADVFGKYAFVFSLYTYLVLFMNPGLDTIGAREIAQRKHSLPEIFTSILSIRVLLAVLVSALAVLIVLTFLRDSDIRRLLSWQAVSLIPAAFLIVFYFQGVERMAMLGWSRVLQSAAFMILVFALIHEPSDVFQLPYFSIISLSITACMMLAAYGTNADSGIARIQVPMLKTLIISMLPIGLSGLLVQIYYNLDTVILGFLAPPQQVGLYAAAYRIVLLLTAIPGILFTVFLPGLSKDTDSGRFSPTFRLFAAILFVIGLPVAACGYFFAFDLLQIIFGLSYVSATLPLQVLLVTVSFVFINVALSNPLLAWNHEKKYLRNVGVGAGVNIIMNFALIPPLGITGAAIATLCSEIAVLFTATKSLSEIAGKLGPVLSLLAIPLASILVAFAASFLLRQSGAVSVATSGFVCIGLYLLLMLTQSSRMKGCLKAA